MASSRLGQGLMRRGVCFCPACWGLPLGMLIASLSLNQGVFVQVHPELPDWPVGSLVPLGEGGPWLVGPWLVGPWLVVALAGGALAGGPGWWAPSRKQPARSTPECSPTRWENLSKLGNAEL